MADDDVDGSNSVAVSCKSGSLSARTGEATQRFSALQQPLLCATIHFFHRHIRSDADVLQRMEGNRMFQYFFEVQYHNKPDLNRIFPDSVHDCSALHVCSFILSILHQGIFSVSAFIVSVIYLSRFKENSHITLHACTWRPLFLTSLLLADKMWEDKPVRNSSLAKLFPVLSNAELNKMEGEFLGEIRFNVLVQPDLFCTFCEKLLAEQVNQEITRCVTTSEYAATLQADQNGEGGGTQPEAQINEQPIPAQHDVNVPAKVEPPLSSRRSFPGPGTGGGALSHRAAGSVPIAWADPCCQSAQPDSAVPRSHSAGPTTNIAQRRNGSSSSVLSHRSTTQTVGPVQASTTVDAPGYSAGAPLSSRSVSAHPLHRSDSGVKRLGAVGITKDGSSVAAPRAATQQHVFPIARGGNSSAAPASQPMRRSLPARSNQYVPLARAGLNGQRQLEPSMSGSVPATIRGTGATPLTAVQVGNSGARQPSAGPQAALSPRSPAPATGTVQRHQVSRVSPAACPGAVQLQSGGGSAPTRASSAPRVSGFFAAGGVSQNARPAGQRPSGCGHGGVYAPNAAHIAVPSAVPPVGGGSVVSGCGHSCAVNQAIGKQHVQQHGQFQTSPAMLVTAMRGSSPVPPTMVGGALPVNVRNTIGHVPSHLRHPSPAGIPGSPAGIYAGVSMAFNSTATTGSRGDGLNGTSRGRSPPPHPVPAACTSSGLVRAPRAATPSSVVKGISQGIRAAANVQRGHLGAVQPITVHR